MTTRERILQAFKTTANLQAATAGRMKTIIHSQTNLITPETIDSSLRTMIKDGTLVREQKPDTNGKNVYHYNPNPAKFEFVDGTNGKVWKEKSGGKVFSSPRE